MEWYQVGAMVVSCLSMFLWSVRIARQDRINSDNQYRSDAKSFRNKNDEFQKELQKLHERHILLEERLMIYFTKKEN